METSPNSIVAISIIDKSVELMGNTNELTTNKIQSQMSEVDIGPYNQVQPKLRPRIFGFWVKTPALEEFNVRKKNFFFQ